MADYADSKKGPGAVFPDGAVADSGFSRVEPLITPEQLMRRHLWGLSLVSGMKNPFTGEAQVMGEEEIADYIDQACAKVELETSLVVFPTKFSEKVAFDPQEYTQFCYIRTKKRPVASIEGFFVTPANDVDVFEVPLDWVEAANLHRGQINVIPLTVSLTKGGATTSPSAVGGAALLGLFGRQTWIPAFWRIEYTAGFPEGKMPKVVNDLIGTTAAIEVLSMLASTYGRSSGSSLSIDGLSQSVSTPGAELYSKRVKDLEAKKAILLKKLKVMYGLSLFSSNV